MGNECPRLKPQILDELQQSTTFSAVEIIDWYKIFIRDFPRGQISIAEFKEAFQKRFLYGDSSMYAEHVFRSYDTNRDGIIDFKEFLTAMYIVYRAPFKRVLEWIFAVFDIDGNGYISPEEMFEVMKSMYKIDYFTIISEDTACMLSQKRTANAFKFLDTNHDRRITLDDVNEGISSEPTLIYFFGFETACLL